MELPLSSKLAHSWFHGIPWNCSCQRNWRILSSMEFHGTSRFSEIGALQVPRNSMEFHGTSRVSEIGALQVPWNSMELLVSAKLAHSKFHGIQWNCSSHRNWRTQSSMEFHGTACVSEIGLLLVPWNSMELFVSLKLAYSKFHGIPWNCFCQRNWRTPSSMEFHGIPWNCSCHRNWCTRSSMEFHGIAGVMEPFFVIQWNHRYHQCTEF